MQEERRGVRFRQGQLMAQSCQVFPEIVEGKDGTGWWQLMSNCAEMSCITLSLQQRFLLRAVPTGRG